MKVWTISFTATAVYDELEFTEREVEEYIDEYASELKNLPFKEKVVSFVKQKFYYTDISFKDAISELIEDMYWDSCPSLELCDFEVDKYEEEESEEE